MRKITAITLLLTLFSLTTHSQSYHKNSKQRFKFELHPEWQVEESDFKSKVIYKNDTNVFWTISWDNITKSSEQSYTSKISKPSKRKLKYKRTSTTTTTSSSNTITTKTDSDLVFIIDNQLKINDKIIQVHCNLNNINSQIKNDIEKMVNTLTGL